MVEPFADTLATVAAARTALVTRLQALAARVEQLPLDAAAEVLVLLEPAAGGTRAAGGPRLGARADWGTVSECSPPGADTASA